MFDHVKKRYGNSELTVKDFHLEVKDKEFLVLVGPSGCGKSTTLRMIAGLEDITEGSLYIDETLVNDVNPKDRDIAMVFQNYALYPHMTVYKNLAFGLKLAKEPKEKIDVMVKETAKILEIEHLLGRKPKALSGGQRQRVALGRAIVRNPKVFLMDEPLSNLDSKLRVQMRTEITKLHKRLGATIVYVTHDQTEAMTMGDRIVIMNEGVVQQVASPDVIYNNPANKYVAGFIGSPSMNFINGRVIEKQGNIYFTTDNIKLPISKDNTNDLKNYINQEITFGIRPEDIYTDIKQVDTNESLVKYTAKIESIENTGSEMFLYFSVDGEPLTVRNKSNPNIKVEQKITLYVDMNKAHFFEKESGTSIKYDRLLTDNE
nr:sn-glycerol-3-phosphate ABC transporter ATP-binding protein UgpC [Chryseomicrobium aureum]